MSKRPAIPRASQASVDEINRVSHELWQQIHKVSGDGKNALQASSPSIGAASAASVSSGSGGTPSGGSPGAPVTASYITVSTEPVLTAYRQLLVATNLSLTDAGAGSNITLGTAAFSGDVTTPANSFVVTISANAVTNAKLAQMPTLTIKGNNTGGTANALDLTTAQVTAMLNPFVASGAGHLQGLVPDPGVSAGTTRYLREDATWVTAVSSVATSQPAAGLTITGGPITTSGTFTFALANDLAALEGLASTGIPQRTGTDTWSLFTTLPASYFPALTGDVTTTAGSLTTTLANIPSGTPMAGSLLATAIAAPTTPAAGKASVYVDSTSKNLAVKNDAGTVNHGVQTKAAVASNFLTAIADNGTVSAAQPAFSDLSGTAAAAQLPGSFSGFANPTASIGLTAVNGAATTAMRSDAAPALDQTIAPTWSGLHLWTASMTASVTTTQTTASPSVSGFACTLTSNPASASSANLRGITANAVIQSGNAQTHSSLQGLLLSVTHGGTNTLTSAVGTFSSLTFNNTGNTTAAYGFRADCTINNANTVGTYRGVFINAPAVSGGGAITTLIGLDIGAMSAGGTNFALRTSTGQTLHQDTTDASSTTTGSLVVSGGAGFAKQVYIGDQLHLAASTTTRASLNFASGTAPTSPAIGDVWRDGTQLGLVAYLAGGIKETLQGVIFTQTADKTVANTAVETSLIGTGVGTTTLPANFWAPGKTIRLKSTGYMADTGTPAFTLKIKVGSVVVFSSGAITLPTLTGNQAFYAEATITCRTTGATGTVFCTIKAYANNGATAIQSFGATVNTATSTVDTTASAVLDATATWGTASASNTITTNITTVEVLN